MPQSPGRGGEGRAGVERAGRGINEAGSTRATHFACAGRRARYSLFRRFPPNRPWPVPPKESARVPALHPLAFPPRLPDRTRPVARIRPVPGQHRRHRRDGERPERRRGARRLRLDQEHRHQPRALPDHGRRRALPRAAPAPRPVPGHGHPQGLRHPGAGGDRADRRPVREPGPRPQGLERPGGDPRLGRLAGDRDDPDGGRRAASTRRRSRGFPTTAGTSSTSRSSPRG